MGAVTRWTVNVAPETGIAASDVLAELRELIAERRAKQG